MKKLLLLACVAAIACGDDSTAFDGGALPDSGTLPDGSLDVISLPDTGTTPDTGTSPDAPMLPGICAADAIVNVTAVDGDTVTETIDTAAATTTPEELGDCGSGTLVNQIVVAVAVPGAGEKFVRISTENEGTDDIDTIIELRTECGVANADGCFDDTPTSLLSTALTPANGGDTVFAVISGYDEGDEGTIELTIEILTNEAPVLTSIDTIEYVGAEDIELVSTIVGSDADGNVVSYNITFVDDAGDDVDLDDDGMADTFTVGFDEDLSGVMAIDTITSVFGPTLAADVNSMRVSLNDELGGESNELTVVFTDGVFAGVGDSCAGTARCEEPVFCSDAEVCTMPTAPTFTAVEAREYVTATETFLAMQMTGGDVDGDVTSYNLTLLDAAGDDVDFDGDGAPDTFTLEFADDLSGQTTFVTVDVRGELTTDWPSDAVGFRVSLVDARGLESPEITLATYTTGGTLGEVGDACAGTQVCDFTMMFTCDDTTMMCVAP